MEQSANKPVILISNGDDMPKKANITTTGSNIPTEEYRVISINLDVSLLFDFFGVIVVLCPATIDYTS